MSLLIVFALMACFGAMVPSDAQASAPMAQMHMTGPMMPHADCMHHHGAHLACHDCPMCAGADVPGLATWDNRVATPARLPGTPGHAVHLDGLRPAGLDRPPRQHG